MNDDTDATRLSGDLPDAADATRTSTSPANLSSTGWLSSTGSVDHGRFAPGTLLDNRYRVLGLLGRGGMGEVYRAEDLRLGQQVALKFLPPALAKDPVRLAQFHNEVRTARQVSHPNVCRVYDIGEVDTADGAGQLFLTMEYVDGEDLSSLLRRIGRLPEDKAIEIARQLCAGLAAAHERGVLHRDLKPANVMLDGAGKVRIMDFSLAAIGAVTDIRAGTPAYMAPEQLGGREVSIKSDIYALGLVLYELFTGRRAFDAKNLADLIEQHQSGTLTSPIELVRTLDPAIERAIMRCLDDNPAMRPASALAVSAALPGGDPLAAALAAGETPSPEMVAAAGTDSATLTPSLAMLVLAAMAAAVFFIAHLQDQSSVLSRSTFNKPLAVLADRAESVRQAAGYKEPFVDSWSGLTYDTGYVDWAADNGSREKHWSELASDRPAVIRFVYRTSPRALTPVSHSAATPVVDPPIQLHGMTLVALDAMGRLLQFEAAPPQVVGENDSPAATDWNPLFAAAEIDRNTFAEVPVDRTPETFADERHTWKGLLPGTTIPVRIEGAAFHGRPVVFDVVGPWRGNAREASDPSSAPGNPSGQPWFIVALLAGAAWTARVNLRSGRADRRGAFRLAAFIFVVLVVQYAVGFHAMDAGDELQRMFVRVGIALFVGGILYLIYLGIEPFVRKNWPTMLVGWSRVLAGRLEDPIVGRDIAVGVLAGAVIAFLNLATDFLRPHGWPAATPLTPSLAAATSVRGFILSISGVINSGLQNSLITVFEFVGMRTLIEVVLIKTSAAKVLHAGVRRVSPSLSERMIFSSRTADFIFAAIFVAISTYLTVQDTATGEQLTGGIYEALSTTIVLFVLLRLGLFAATVMFVVNLLLVLDPLTLDSSRLHAPAGFGIAAIVMALGLYGIWQARAGQPLFSQPSRAR